MAKCRDLLLRGNDLGPAADWRLQSRADGARRPNSAERHLAKSLVSGVISQRHNDLVAGARDFRSTLVAQPVL
jgi:hypothetical protein